MFMDRKDLQELSRVRLKEATALLQPGLFDGAYHLAGYAVEWGPGKIRPTAFPFSSCGAAGGNATFEVIHDFA
jgi:hypothetical protein